MTELTLRQIDKIRALLASAIEAGAIRALDRDTVTAALRDIYDEVLSMPEASLPIREADEHAAEPVPCAEPDETDDDTVDEPDDAEPSETNVKERDNGLADVTVPWAQTPPAIPTDPEPEQPVTTEETYVPEEPEEDVCAEQEEEDAVAVDDETVASDVEETEVHQDDEEADTEATEETVIIAEADDTAEDEPHDPDPVEEITMSAEPILPEPTRMERMLSDDMSLAARLGQERLAAVADELCHGDTEACLDMMEALEATGDFDMAVLYIQEHYPQKSDSRAIDMLVEVLSAKFI